MKQIIPINVTGGVSRTIYSHYYKSGWHDFDPTSSIPHTAILEIEIMEEPKVKCIGSVRPERSWGTLPKNQDRIYIIDGIAPTLNCCDRGGSEPKILQVGSYSPSSARNAKVLDADGICPTLLDHKGMEPAIIEPCSCAIRGRNPENPSDRTAGINTEQRLELGGDVANCLTSVQKDSMIVEQVIGSMQSNAMHGSLDGVSPCLTEAMGTGGGQIPVIVQNAHGYNEGGLLGDFSPTVTSSAFQDNNFVATRSRIRKLTPRECFRLMGMDDADIDKIDAYRIKTALKDGTVKEKPIPKSQKYKMAGNSIVVDVLYNIFYQMFIAEPPKPQPKQLSLFEL